MPRNKWTVLDVDSNEDLMSGKSEPVTLGDRDDLKVEVRNLTGGLRDGVQVLELVAGDARCRIVPTRGLGIWDFHYGQERLGWKSPVRGPVHPKFVDVGEPSGLGWLDGFDELFVRCGLESNGAPEFGEEGRLAFPLHGRIANRPAHQVAVEIDDEQGEITVTGVVEETRFHFLKLQLHTTLRIRKGESAVHVEDRIENLSASDAEIQMLYHVNFGIPLLDAGSRVVVPAKTVVPRNERAAAGIANWDAYEAAQPGFEEQVYFLELNADEDGQTQSLLKNAHGTRGVSLQFNKKQLPCFTVWKNTTAAEDGYVTGIEPGTNFPNPRTYEGEQGRFVALKPRSSHTFRISVVYHPSEAAVEAAENQISRLQGGAEPRVFDAPQPRWCAP